MQVSTAVLKGDYQPYPHPYIVRIVCFEMIDNHNFFKVFWQPIERSLCIAQAGLQATSDLPTLFLLSFICASDFIFSGSSVLLTCLVNLLIDNH